MKHIEALTNNNFLVLSYLYDRKDKENLVRITQGDISEDLGLSKGTVITIFKNLKEYGYLGKDEKHIGRYLLTNDAVKVVELFRKSSKIKD